MKKRAVEWMVSLLVLTTITSACSDSTQNGEQKTTKPTADPTSEQSTTTGEVNTKLSGKIVSWAGGEEFVELFNKKYPNITVEFAKGIEKMSEKFKTAVATGTGAPDVYMLGSGDYRGYKEMEGLENLLDPPYNAGKYKKDFTETAWSLTSSLDGKRLYGMPWYNIPFLMFYRWDIMEENGFPSDPAELGKYIEDPVKFFNMAKALRAKNHYFFRWTGEVTEVASDGSSYFDKDYKFLRNTDTWVRALDYAKQAKQLDIVLDVGGDERKQAILSGKLMAYFQSPDRMGFIEDNMNEMKGKWRATTLPFGSALARNMQAYVIPSQSKNKEAAWAFVEFMTTNPEVQKQLYKRGIVPGYKPAWTLPEVEQGTKEVLGGQNVAKLSLTVMDKMKYPPGSMLDKEAEDMWDDKIDEVLEKNMDSRAALSVIQDFITKSLSSDIEKYRSKKN